MMFKPSHSSPNRFTWLLLGVLVFLVGCSKSDALETTVFESKDGGVQTVLTYYHSGDDVKKQTADNVIPYASIPVETKEEAQEILEPFVTQFKGIKGITHEMTYNDDHAVEHLEIDYETLNFDKARSLPGMTFDENSENGISLEKSRDLLEQNGYTEKTE